MELFYTLVIFILGTVVGSFLNVVALRNETGETLSGRSHCPFCKHKLSSFDLVPILSFLWLKGRCRYCGKKLSIQYPLVEAITGFSFALLYISSSFYSSLQFVFFLFLTSVFIVHSVSDFRMGLLPDRFTLIGLLGTAIYLLLGLAFYVDFSKYLLLPLLSSFGLGAFFLILIIITKGKGMGGGDFKLSILIGLSLSWPLAIVALILAFLTGAIVSVMLLLRGKKGLKGTVPFGPFLALGSYLSIVFGEMLLKAYLKTLGF